MLSLCQTVRCQLSYGQANTPVFDAGQGGWNSRLLPSWPWPHSDACMRQSRVWPNCAQRLLSELPAPYCSRSNAPARGGGGQGGGGKHRKEVSKTVGVNVPKNLYLLRWQEIILHLKQFLIILGARGINVMALGV